MNMMKWLAGSVLLNSIKVNLSYPRTEYWIMQLLEEVQF